MKDIEGVKLRVNATIKDALSIIDSGAIQIALIVDESSKLLGTLTDGDIRRAFLKGLTLEDSIKDVFYQNPTTVNVNATKQEIINICTEKKIYQVPVVDDSGCVMSVDILDELLKPKVQPNRVILMVGGLGSRLLPLTENMPKPMLCVGEQPILQTIVENFASYGFVNITMCVNYKSHIIKDYFGDGSKFGVNIDYILEDSRMGTVGALSLLENVPAESFFVMNGDLLTKVNFEHLLDFHISNEAMATMCVREYDFQVPYGVVNVDNGNISSIEEKPVYKFFVSAGMYMIDPRCVNLIPKHEFYDMPTLFEKLIAAGEITISFPLREYWLDIGRIDEYEKANREYKEVF